MLSKLSIGQLVAAVSVTVQLKHAILLTRMLSENSALITIGVSSSSHISVPEID